MDTTNLSELIKKRGTCKTRLTYFEKYLNGFKGAVSCSEVQALEMKLRITKMDENFTEFNQVQMSIEQLTEEDELDEQVMQRTDFETQFYRNMARAKEIYNLYKKSLPPKTKKSIASNASSSSASELEEDEDTVMAKGSSVRGIKLPTINIPKFSGDYGNWLEFRDTFSSLIHNNASISNVQKFHYLRASLEGGAAQIIRALEFSAGNYSVAWTLLCERYDNTRLLIQNHVKGLFDEEPIKKESASAIRKLLDSYNKNLRALQILEEPTDQWDTLIIYIVSSKLDARTQREWEEHKGKISKINLNTFNNFLKNRADLLETIELSTNKPNNTTQTNKTNKSVKGLTATMQPTQDKIYTCILCNDERHALYQCNKFLQMSVDEREQVVKKHNLCANCFRFGHNKRACRLGPCKTCKKDKHNTLLHRNKVSAETVLPTKTALSVNNMCGQVLLATAIIKILDVNNKPHEVRAILDSGSQASFMTESLMSKLGLQSQNAKVSVAGINNAVSTISKSCNTIIQSKLNNAFETKVSFLVLPYITSSSNQTFDVNTINIPSYITLADPDFYIPSSLDVLLGADIFWDLLGTNQLRLGKNYPVLQETKFGYIVSGPTGKLSSNISCNFSQFNEIQDQLTKFWTIEEVPDSHKPVFSVEENMCEKDFLQNVSRQSDGRFSVGIPLKGQETQLGNSFERAKYCFLSLEKRLQRQATLKAMYKDFMLEYAQLGHMTKSDINNPPPNSYFLPHHGVLREQSTTTKLRVVFNGSAPTTSGVSLNDIQMVGPTIQSDLVSILLRFRQHRFVMAGDIEKMYRQVLINCDQRHLQQIVWRDDPSEPLQSYALNTVTYGTASAPFLAVRCLKQLADDCSNEQIRQIITEDFYVDDLLTGCDTAEGLIHIRTLVVQVLASGCFKLRKFKSNLPTKDDANTNDDSTIVDLSEHEQSSTLGLKWSPANDQLQFTIKTSNEEKVTKRVILSTISQVFDPLGLLSIFIITGKIILQRLWLQKLQWDDMLPRDILNSWTKFVANLVLLNNLRIPRFVLCVNSCNIQLHAFSDSSKDAYGACVYVRSEDHQGNVKVHLLFSKSRVAPLKPVTIPRLELCGALVAAKLIQKVLTTTRLSINRCFLWTDSSVVLGWLKTPPNRLKEFVKNRVAEIQERTRDFIWRHVPTASNPADMLSRGVNVSEVDKVNMWWKGPKFLTENENHWPNKSFDHAESELPEVKSNLAINNFDPLFPFSRFSNFKMLKNTMAYVLRFINNCKTKVQNGKALGPLSHTEKQKAHFTLLKLSQRECFPEYNILQNKGCLPLKNTLLSLSPFIDTNGLLRVGGRIKNGDFSFDKKHPVLLSSKHPLTKLIFENEHVRLMHAGPQLLLSSIREEIWPLGGRDLSKRVVHNCQRCFRLNARTVNPIMGNLPEQRLQPGYPFQTTGMDYAGPIIALNRRGRGSKTEKAYIAIFVCFTTKSMHLELVSDLTKDAFLSALRRFIARRSKPQALFSDNGTQFVGASNELSKFFKDNSQSIIDSLSDEGIPIEFKFHPAYTPHMAGLAEASVKSVKHHLRRVLGNSHLVFEDLYTVLVQIEAILNSRPLTPMSPDPNDLSPLTPGHFLVGRPLTALPTPSLIDTNPNRLSRFERLQQMREQFWARWHKEYVAELQQRTKWRTSKGCLAEGALVLIKEDSLPPMKWSLGRVMKVYPGSDGISRVADLKTSKGIVRRAFNRICPLPQQEDVSGLKDQPFNAGGHVYDASS